MSVNWIVSTHKKLYKSMFHWPQLTQLIVVYGRLRMMTYYFWYRRSELDIYIIKWNFRFIHLFYSIRSEDFVILIPRNSTCMCVSKSCFCNKNNELFFSLWVMTEQWTLIKCQFKCARPLDLLPHVQAHITHDIGTVCCSLTE